MLHSTPSPNWYHCQKSSFRVNKKLTIYPNDLLQRQHVIDMILQINACSLFIILSNHYHQQILSYLSVFFYRQSQAEKKTVS